MVVVLNIRWRRCVIVFYVFSGVWWGCRSIVCVCNVYWFVRKMWEVVGMCGFIKLCICIGCIGWLVFFIWVVIISEIIVCSNSNFRYVKCI